MNAIPKALISPRTFSVLFLSIAFAFDRSPLQFATSAADSLPSRINPIGIKGTLFLVGGPLTEEILEQVSEVDTDIRHILALQLDSSQQTQQSTRQLLDAWQQHEFVSLEVQKAGKTETDLNRIVQALRETDMVFLLAHDREALEQHLAERQLRQAIRSVVDQGGMIVGEGILAEYAGDHTSSDNELGLGLLPDACLTISEQEDENTGNPQAVHYELAPGSTLVAQGRQLLSNGSLRITLPAGAKRPARTFEFNTRSRADLTALRRALQQRRQGTVFPPDKPAAPFLENGTVIAIGGDGMPAGIIDEFVKRAGGEEASIVVLPTAMPDPIRPEHRMADAFRKAGAGQVTVLPKRTLTAVMSEPYQDAFRNATGIWFDGGRQWRFVDAYSETPIVELMHDVLRRGGVTMGSSAGASIQAEYMVRGNPLGNQEMMAEGYEQGFGFLRGVAIDQHFTGRNRFADMSSLMQRFPQLLGIGIDGGTAIIVEGSTANVVGKGSVHFYDAAAHSPDDERDYQSVKAGGSYDLRERRILSNPESSPASDSP